MSTGGVMIESTRLSVTFHIEPSAQVQKYEIDYNRNLSQYIKLQPFNCLFRLILAEYEGNCIVSCTPMTWTWRPPFSYSFSDILGIIRVLV